MTKVESTEIRKDKREEGIAYSTGMNDETKNSFKDLKFCVGNKSTMEQRGRLLLFFN